MRRIPAIFAAALATLILALAGMHAALAQQPYPEKPIRIVSPFPLAVSGPARSPVIAEVPTAAELGFVGLERD